MVVCVCVFAFDSFVFIQFSQEDCLSNGSFFRLIDIDDRKHISWIIISCNSNELCKISEQSFGHIFLCYCCCEYVCICVIVVVNTFYIMLHVILQRCHKRLTGAYSQFSIFSLIRAIFHPLQRNTAIHLKFCCQN